MATTHSANAASPLRALFRVFVQPQLSSSTRIAPQWLQQGSGSAPNCLNRQSRAFATTSRQNAKTRAPEARKQKWDNEIKTRVIKMVNLETGGLQMDEETQQPKRVTRYDVLRDLDLKQYRLVQVTEDDDPEHWDAPVCKIISKKDVYDAEQKKKAQQKEAKAVRSKEQSLKTLELNWAIDQNDLGHRLDKVKEFLAEGRKVEIVLASKKRGRKATPQECKEVLDKIKGVVGEVKGAVEAKPFDGKMAGFGTVVLQGKASAAAKQTAVAA